MTTLHFLLFFVPKQNKRSYQSLSGVFLFFAHVLLYHIIGLLISPIKRCANGTLIDPNQILSSFFGVKTVIFFRRYSIRFCNYFYVSKLSFTKTAQQTSDKPLLFAFVPMEKNYRNITKYDVLIDKYPADGLIKNNIRSRKTDRGLFSNAIDTFFSKITT